MGDHAGILGAVVRFFPFFPSRRSSHQWLKHHCLLRKRSTHLKNVSYTVPTTSGVQARPPRRVMSPFVHFQIPCATRNFIFIYHNRSWKKNSIHYQPLFSVFTLYILSIVCYIEGYEGGDSDWVEIYGANQYRAVSRGKMGCATGEGRGTSSIRLR